jgi:PAS domain S-box-containing protein
MCVASLEGLLLQVNPAMCKALEMTEESLRGYPFYKLFYPQDHEHVRELVNRLSAGLPVEEVVIPMKSSRGNRVLFEWSCPPVLPETDMFTPVGRIL